MILRGAVAALALAACAGGRERSGVASARGWYYADNSGLDVATVAVDADQAVSERVSVDGRVLLDRVTLRRQQIDPTDPGHQHDPGGHQHDHQSPDAVTSASTLAGGGANADEDRWEGRVRAVYRDHDRDDRPWQAWAGVRGSTEPDYLALSVVAGGSIELAQRNTTVAGELGYGRDVATPVEAPPGQDDAWPASHQRVTASLSLSQVATRWLVVSAGVATTFQRGQLASPYRRALVSTSLFPEEVPDARDRYLGFVAAHAALSAKTAAHLRLGGYRDSWSVAAIIPEVALARVLGARGLATAAYRYYRQAAADFYRHHYDDLAPMLSGDSRLGPVRAHTAGLHLRWTVRGSRGERGALTAEAGYQWMRFDFPLQASDAVIGHQAALGMSGEY